MNDPLSVWLVPAKDDEQYLSQIIKDLAEKYDAPPFTPHLTLFGNVEIETENLKKILDEIFFNIKSFRIRKQQINQSENFFKTVFIETYLDDVLSSLFNKISQKTDKRDISSFKPHISLIYKTMPENQKIEIINSLSIKDEFIIDRVFINSPKPGDKEHRDIEGWKILYEKSLDPDEQQHSV